MIKKINRMARSVISLNRYTEFRTLVRMMRIDDKDYLLDVGSGDGYWTCRLASIAGSVVGIDPNPILLELARKHYSKSNLLFEEGSAENLPYDDSTFEKVVSVSVVEHFDDPVKGIAEMARVLQPRGILAISVDSLLQENSNEKFRKFHKKKHFVTTYFTLSGLYEILEDHGLKPAKSETVGLFSSKFSGKLREIFIKNTKLFLPLFPLFLLFCKIGDRLSLGGRQPPQILIVNARKL